ncbi:sigma-54 dependent transcriptional regulator [Desulforhabdus sp. TSK]|uniref:sigma-54-dependent transcriptional regulator n=1 Tax=Desulforhabdus sp. TSK TaxID=2925014 RepID=UPI001FC8EA7C|nr:sigma-54 dependent transcriptional regulator [Desulforhabdus sp. TSK]GKT07496.1 sigma-54-dependent Fis family transcriptional regulator [Desulforhabdus sp. TSK]
MAPFEPMRILVVDDEESIRRLAKKEFSDPHRKVWTAGSAHEAFELVRRQQVDVIVLDIRLPDGDGLELLEQFRETLPDVEVIIITGHGNIDSAVEAMKSGAYDYITKPFTLDRLELVIEKAFQRVRLQRENRLLRHTQSYQPSPRFIGSSAAIQHIQYLIGKVAPTDVPVLITGESGAGKDVVARAIHGLSRRQENPLIIKNCGTLQKELIRSELFGYCKGAFTGATESQEGLLTLAHQGTLFLDEIGELPLEVQASLLRVLENQTFRRVGDKQERQVDVRFLFATNRNLAEEVKASRFHEALYHRINVFQLDLPPLRQRKEDIPLLVEYFLGLLSAGKPPCRISKNVMHLLMEYSWPGNVRELRNVMERGMILSENGIITAQGLPRELAEQNRYKGTVLHGERPLLSLYELEKQHIQRVLEHTSGNRSQASDTLGISRKTLYRKLKEYGLE